MEESKRGETKREKERRKWRERVEEAKKRKETREG